jgi:hypothetical protein
MKVPGTTLLTLEKLCELFSWKCSDSCPNDIKNVIQLYHSIIQKDQLLLYCISDMNGGSSRHI